MSSSRRLSGLQRQVLASYRESLRAVRQLPPPSRAPAAAFARQEYRRHAATIDRLDHQRIEHLLRHASKKAKQLVVAGGFVGGDGHVADAALRRIVGAE